MSNLWINQRNHQNQIDKTKNANKDVLSLLKKTIKILQLDKLTAKKVIYRDR